MGNEGSTHVVDQTDRAAAAERPAELSWGESVAPPAGEAALYLTSAQQRLWLLDQQPGGRSALNDYRALRLRGPLGIAFLQQSLNELIRQHDYLRAIFSSPEECPVLAVALALVDLRSWRRDEQRWELQRQAVDETARPFDLSRSALFRAKLLQLAEEEHVLLLTAHEILTDQAPLDDLVQDLARIYSCFCHGKSPVGDRATARAGDFACLQREWLGSAAAARERAYWKQQLAGAPPALELPVDHPRPAAPTFRGAKVGFRLPQDRTAALEELSHKQGSNLFATVLAAFKTLLWRYTSQEDLVVGSYLTDWAPAPEEVPVSSHNLLVLRTDLSGDPTFEQLLARVAAVAGAAHTHRHYPFEHLVEDLLPRPELSRVPLVQCQFDLKMARPVPEFTGLVAEFLDIDNGTALHDLALALVAEAGELRGDFQYNSDLFDDATVRRLAGQFRVLLEGILANPRQRLAGLPLLTEGETQRLVVAWNATRGDYPRHRCLHQLFEAQVERTPDAVAVTFEGRHLTYRELNARANQLARHLQRRGARPGALVGIALDRSLEMLVALLGTLKAGAAYVPLDPSYPTDRLAFMVTDAQVALLLSQEHLRDSRPAEGAEVICLDSDWATIAREASEDFPSPARPDDLAYVLYTSGSTGKPKGVQIPHAAVVNFLTAMRLQPGLTDQDTLLAVTTLSFDIAGLECFLPVVVGARLVLASREVASNGARLLELLNTSGATVMQATPATWRLLLEGGWQPGGELKVLCGGEALPGTLAGQILERCTALWNMYGPTETTIWSMLHRVEGASEGVARIGRPIANTQVYVVNGQLQPMPVGVPGELLIGGDGLAWGYLNRPALTAEKFVPDPFGPVPGARLYRTGDLVRYQADGSIEFLGRIDHQVKVRGFRIELGEIEAVLSRHPAVREVVVLAREDSPGDKRLIAYLVADPRQAPRSSELRDFLKEQLADYMIPSAFVLLEAFPRTPNGKVNRRALPAPEVERSNLESDFVAPRNSLEMQVARMWEEVLNIRPIGVKDNIFELGADSLLIARLAARIQQVFGKSLSPDLLFRAPTVEQLVGHLQQPVDSPGWKALSRLHPGGSGVPFFCVHGGRGGVFQLPPLASYLGQDRPVYGLQAVGWHDDMAPHTTIAEMAAFYVREIGTVQPHGPYLLGGYCFGGIIAFEMAQQLRQAGHEVAIVILFNAPNPAANRVSPTAAAQARAGQGTPSFRSRVAQFGQEFRNLRFRGKVGYVARKLLGGLFWKVDHSLRSWRRAIRLRTKWLLIRCHQAVGHPLPPELRSLFLLDLSNGAERQYVPESYPGRVVVFRRTSSHLDPYLGNEPDLGWARVVGENLETYEIPVPGRRRGEILQEPFVRQTADQVRDCLRRVEAARTALPPVRSEMPFLR